jgi:tetratricopeptide (TPR) repeat protein
MRRWQSLTVWLLLVSSAAAQQPGDVVQTRQDVDLSVDCRPVLTLPIGATATVEKVDKGSLLCCASGRSGWVDRHDVMTLEEAVIFWRDAIRRGDLEAYIYLAYAHEGVGDMKQCVADLTKYLRSNPGSPQALSDRGFAYVKLGDTANAEKDFSLSIQIEPTAGAYCNRANVWLVLGRGKAALEDCNAALKLEPENLYALANRGSAHRLLGQYAEAVADYERALKLDGDSFAVLRNFALLRGAAVDGKFRDGKQAVEMASKACAATFERDALSLSSLAVAYAESGDWDAAIKSQKLAAKREKLDKNQAEHKRRLELFEAHQPLRLEVGQGLPDD